MDEHLGLNNIVNEGMSMLIDRLDLNNIGVTVKTTLWPGGTDLELVLDTFELPKTSNATTNEEVDIFFGNEAAREEYRVFKTSIKPTGKGLPITSLSILDSWRTSYL